MFLHYDPNPWRYGSRKLEPNSIIALPTSPISDPINRVYFTTVKIVLRLLRTVFSQIRIECSAGPPLLGLFQIELYLSTFCILYSFTWSVWSLNTCWHCMLSKSQTRTVLSALPDTKRLPSGENATERTHDACPDNVPAKFAWTLKYNRKQYLETVAGIIQSSANNTLATSIDKWKKLLCLLTTYVNHVSPRV